MNRFTVLCVYISANLLQEITRHKFMFYSLISCSVFSEENKATTWTRVRDSDQSLVLLLPVWTTGWEGGFTAQLHGSTEKAVCSQRGMKI